MGRIKFRNLLVICFASTITCLTGCTNNPKTNDSSSSQKTEVVKDPVRDEYVKFLDQAASSPITEYDLFDGFRFDMTKKQVSARQSKYKKKKEKDFVLVKMNGNTYTSSFEDRYLDDKLYDLEMTIFSVGDGDYKPLSRGDLNSLIAYFKSKYNGYTYLYVGEPVVTGPTYLWNKNNMIVKVAALYAGSDINSITVEFENYPIIRGISKKLNKEQMEKIRQRAETKVLNKKSPIVGMFVCKKTNDKYVFNDDGTGYFFTGGTNTEFKWSYKNDIVTLVYETFGKEYLLFDPKRNTLKEDSESYGIIIFEKI